MALVVTIQPMREDNGYEVVLHNTVTEKRARLHMFWLADQATNAQLADSYADEIRSVL